MLSGIARFLFGSSSIEEPQQQNDVEKVEETKAVPAEAMETEAEKSTQDTDWVVVEYSDCSFGKRSPQQKSRHVSKLYDVTGRYGDTSDSASPSPSSDISLSPVSKSRHVYVRINKDISSESWFLTPPQCFAAGTKDSTQVEITLLENLLIEHPSMSVYKRSGSTGDTSDISESSNEENSLSPQMKTRSQSVRQSPKRARTVTARAQLMAQVACVKSAQRVKSQQATRSYSKKTLQRSNLVKDSHTKGKTSGQRSRASRPSGQMCGRVSQRMQ